MNPVKVTQRRATVCHAARVSARVISLLDRPTYTYPQVDRLLGLTKGTAQRWLNGYRSGGKSYDPILRRERIDTRWATWGEFVETRLLANYRDEDDIPVQRMRRAIEVLREEIDADYPLARGYLYLEPKGRELLLKAQEPLALLLGELGDGAAGGAAHHLRYVLSRHLGDGAAGAVARPVRRGP